MSEMLTVNAVAQRLNVSPSHIRKLFADGLLPAVNIASLGAKHKMLRVPSQAVDDLLASRTTNTLAIDAQKKKRRITETRRSTSSYDRMAS